LSVPSRKLVEVAQMPRSDSRDQHERISQY